MAYGQFLDIDQDWLDIVRKEENIPNKNPFVLFMYGFGQKRMKVHEDVFVRLRVMSIIADPYFQSTDRWKHPIILVSLIGCVD